MRDKIKYVILIGSLIAAGLLCVILAYQVKKSSSELDSNTAVESDVPDVFERIHGLYTQDFNELRSMCGQDWYYVLRKIETFCAENDIDPNKFYCIDGDVNVTQDNDLYVTASYTDRKFIILVNTDTSPPNVYIEELK